MVIGVVSCSRANPVLPEEEGKKTELPPARITETIRYEEDNCTAYNIEYPSTDPYGKPVTLSGAIVVGDEITRENPAKGLFLYNHFTAYASQECPSRGDLAVQKIIVGSGLISITSDLYGFGITEDKHQAYGMADANGEASVDAFIAARELLADIGYTWDNVILNLGYSQGGQIAMAALKVLTEKHPDIRFTHTFAGGGLYDVSATFRFLVSAGESPLTDAVISVLLAYNEFYNLGFSFDLLFKEPLCSNIDNWFFSKKYKGSELMKLIGTERLDEFMTPELMDPDSDISKKFIAAMNKESLCRGWAPWLNEQITLVHNKADNIVPVVNAENLLRFLENHGLTVNSRIENYLEISGVLNPHLSGAVPFFTSTISQICSILGIGLWIDPSKVLELFRENELAN